MDRIGKVSGDAVSFQQSCHSKCLVRFDSMVLNVEDLQRDFGLSREDSEKMRSRRELYSFMHEKRLACHFSDLAKRKERVAESGSVHYRSLACKEALKSVCNDELKRREIISFFDELNDLGATRSFTRSGLKETMIAIMTMTLCL